MKNDLKTDARMQKWKETAFHLLLVLLGNALYALTVKLFLLPAGLVTGGTTGIALAVNHVFGLSISLFVLLFNILMLVVGALTMGRQFAVTTLLSSFLYPVLLELFDRLLGGVVLTDDVLLSTIFSGLGIGVGLGVVIRAGASTGGMDIPPLILQKYWRIPVSVGLYVFDFLILLMQGLFQPAEKVLYGILLMIVYTTVIDKLLLVGTSKIEIKVVSRKSQEIRDAIMSQIDRGVTVLRGEGGYLHRETEVLLSVVSNRELPRVERLIRQIDAESFIVVSHVSEVRGRGFSISKKYR